MVDMVGAAPLCFALQMDMGVSLSLSLQCRTQYSLAETKGIGRALSRTAAAHRLCGNHDT
jgi:hypothetical protein